jgi:RND family efflux transporter MFP subunit
MAMMHLGEKEEEPVQARGPRTLQTAEVVPLVRSSFAVFINSQGVVRPHNSTLLTPRVAGRVQTIHSRFEPGAFFKKGDVLLELDSSDFDAALAGAEARLARADAELAQENARAEQALLDWVDLGYTDPPSDLVLRKPQLKEAEANVKAAQADLVQAQRNLERSQVLAPYEGCVLVRNVGPGQSVSSGTALGEIFSTDFAEIRLPLSTDSLPFVNLPGEDTETVEAILTDALNTAEEQSWKATILRSEGVLDETSRELFVIAQVDDPYGLQSDHPRLRIGQPVRARIAGKVLKNVFVIPRKALRSPTEIILVNPDDSTIRRTEIDPIWSDESQVIVSHNLPEDADEWLLVVTRLPWAADGAEIEIIPAGEGPKAAQTPEVKTDA